MEKRSKKNKKHTNEGWGGRGAGREWDVNLKLKELHTELEALVSLFTGLLMSAAAGGRSPVGLTWPGSRSWSRPLRVLSTWPSPCGGQGTIINKPKSDPVSNQRRTWTVPLLNGERKTKWTPTCFSQPWTVVCSRQRASGSSPWRASGRCRSSRGWSWEQNTSVGTCATSPICKLNVFLFHSSD